MIFRFITRTSMNLFRGLKFTPYALKSEKKVIEVSKEEVESMKKFMSGDEEELSKIQSTQSFFEDEEQLLSFKLMKISTMEEFFPLFDEYEQSPVTTKFLLFYKFINAGGKLDDPLISSYKKEIYEKIDEINEQYLGRLLSYLYFIKKRDGENHAPENLPLIKNPTHTNTNIIVYLNFHYPDKFDQIYEHYYLEQGVYSCIQLAYILVHLKKNMEQVQNLLRKSFAEATEQEKIVFLNYCLNTGEKLNFDQYLTKDIVSSFSLPSQIKILYNIVSTKNIKYIHETEIIEQIKEKAEKFQGIYSPHDFLHIWTSAMIFVNYYHKVYIEKRVFQLENFTLESGIQVAFEQLSSQQLFTLITSYRTVMPIRLSDSYLGEYFVRQMKTRAVLKTILRKSRQKLKGEQVVRATLFASAYECEESFICPEVLEILAKFKNHKRWDFFTNKMLKKWQHDQ